MTISVGMISAAMATVPYTHPTLTNLRQKVYFSIMYLSLPVHAVQAAAALLQGGMRIIRGAAELHSPLPAHLKFFPELLRQNGYFSALLGKWHEGENTRRAYDTVISGLDKNGSGGELQWINMLQQRPKNQPFFLWLAPFDAHRPWSDDNMDTHHHHDPGK